MTSINIIFVEDYEDDLILANRALKKSGIKPNYIRVETREDLMAALTEEQWQLVISDYHMPAFSAPEALDTLKASGCDLPFIVYSSTIEDELAEDLVSKGAIACIKKQDMYSLAQTVQQLLPVQSERFLDLQPQ